MFTTLFLALLGLSQTASASPHDIHTFAGTGQANYFGDGGPAVMAGLNSPVGVAIGPAGDVYVADRENSTIRKVDTDGVITTVAGTGIAGYTGDTETRVDRWGNIKTRKPVSAISSSLNLPGSVAVGPSGAVYIADTYNNRIRMVADGNIFTIAGNGTTGFSGDGGLAVSSRLNHPEGIVSDSLGNIYVADTGNNRIRKIDTAGIITTVAGTGSIGYSGDGGAATSAALNSPVAVAVDVAGNVYMADSYNNRVRKVDLSGTITTVAGNGLTGPAAEGAQAVSTGIGMPTGVALDGAGNIYISEGNGHHVWKVDTDGLIKNFAGGGGSGHAGDGGPAVAAQLDFPSGIAVDRDGNLFVADSMSNNIRMVEGPLYTLPVSTLVTPRNGENITSNSYTVNGKASAANGVAYVEVSTDAGMTWNTAIGGESFSYTWWPETEGSHVVLSRSTDSLGRREKIMSSSEVSVSMSASVDPVSIDLLTPVPSAATAGGSVIWTATASGGTGSYLYQFMRSGPDTGGTYVVARDWSSSRNWTWYTSTSMAGSNAVKVNVINSDGSGNTSSGSYPAYAVQYPAIVINSLVADIPGTANSGDTVTWTAGSSGGSGSYEYQFVRSGPDTGGSYVVMRDWAASGSWSWVTTGTMVGDNVVMVRVRNTDGSGQVSKSVSYTIVQVVASIVIGSLSPSMPSAAVGDSVVWTAAATGGTGSYQYQFERSGPDTSGAYVVTQNWGASSAWTWATTSQAAGSSTVRVSVRNSDGTGAVSLASSAYTVSTGAMPPTLGGVSAANGTAGVAQTATAVYSDPNGQSELNLMYMQLSDGSRSFMVKYDRSQNVLLLKNDADTAWLTGYAPGSQNIISNAQGSLDCAGTTVSFNGNDAAITWKFTPAENFTGTKDVNLLVWDNTGLDSGWHKMASMTIAAPAPSTPPTSPVSVSSLAANPASAAAGDTVNWTAAATGGTGSYLFQFMRRGPDTSGSFVIARDWASSNTWSWSTSTAMAGVSTIKVNVKDSDGSGTTASKESSYSLSSANLGTAHYVDSVNGNDSNNGLSSTSPWKTLAKVNSYRPQPGERILLKRGSVWRETLNPPVSGGTNNHITYDAYGTGAMPLILGSDSRTGTGNWTQESGNVWYTSISSNPPMVFHNGVGSARMATKSTLSNAWDWWYDSATGRVYVYLSTNPGGYSIEIAQRNGIGYSTVSWIAVRNIEMAFVNNGIGLWGGSNWVIDGVYIHDATKSCIQGNNVSRLNTVRNSVFQDWNWSGYQSVNGGGDNNKGYGVQVLSGAGGAASDQWVITGNRLTIKNMWSGNDTTAINIDQQGHATLIADNIVEGNSAMGGNGVMFWRPKGATPTEIRDNVINNVGGMGINVSDFGANGFVADVLVSGNLITNSCTMNVLDEEGLRVWTNTSARVTVQKNLVAGTKAGSNSHHGIRVRASVAKLYNNTVYGTDRGISVESGSNVTAYNNISASNRSYAGYNSSSTITESNNCWYGSTAGFSMSGSDKTSNPAFVNAGAGDFSLQSSSPCREAGINVGLPYSGNAPNMGAF